MRTKTAHDLWEAFHAFTRCQPPPEQGRAWLEQFDAAVVEASADTCPCARHWASLRDELPPDFDALEAWGVEMHDRVNVRLGKLRFARARPPLAPPPGWRVPRPDEVKIHHLPMPTMAAGE